MVQTQKVVEQLGYTPNEAKVYIAVLSLGECHVSDIASKLKMPLSSAQVIVDKLHKNGLMNFYVKNRYKYWVAENPERLLSQLEQREELVRANMPALEALRRKKNGSAGKPTIKIFTGRDEIKLIFDDIIATKHHILAIIPEDAFLDLFAGTSTVDEFIESHMRRFLRIRILAPDTPAGRELANNAGKYLR
jgi:sugar-specific transcriptional regulator TrmB